MVAGGVGRAYPPAMIVRVERGSIHLKVGDRDVQVRGEMIPYPPDRDAYFWVHGVDHWDDGAPVTDDERIAIDAQLVADASARGLSLDFDSASPPGPSTPTA